MTILVTDQTVYTTLSTMTCYKCGVLFAMTHEYVKRRREDRAFFHCPNGHEQHFTGPSELQKKTDEAARLQARNDQLQAELKTQRGRTTKVKNQLSATKGVLTRMKNRAANGVCPCCNRSFENLRRHMQSKHPEFTAAE